MTDRYTKAAESLKVECIVQDFDAETAEILLRAQFAERDAAVAELVAAALDRQQCCFGYEGCLECRKRLNEAIGAMRAMK